MRSVLGLPQQTWLRSPQRLQLTPQTHQTLALLTESQSFEYEAGTAIGLSRDLLMHETITESSSPCAKVLATEMHNTF